MDKMLLTLVIAVFTVIAVQAQYTIENESHNKIITQVDENVYNVSFKTDNGRIVQEGQYWKDGKQLKPHGLWKLHAQYSDEVITTSKYEKGKQVWIETKIDGEFIRYDENELKIKKHRDQVSQPEKDLSDLQKRLNS